MNYSDIHIKLSIKSSINWKLGKNAPSNPRVKITHYRSVKGINACRQPEGERERGRETETETQPRGKCCKVFAAGRGTGRCRCRDVAASYRRTDSAWECSVPGRPSHSGWPWLETPLPGLVLRTSSSCAATAQNYVWLAITRYSWATSAKIYDCKRFLNAYSLCKRSRGPICQRSLDNLKIVWPLLRHIYINLQQC